MANDTQQAFKARKEQMDAFGTGILVSFSVLLGLNQALVKLVNAGLAPVFQAGLRSACAFIPVLIWSLLKRRRLSFTDGSFKPGMLNGLFFSLEFCLLFTALEYTSVARVSLFFYIMPFWVAIGAHFLIPEEPLTRRKVIGLILAVAGVSLALSDDNSKPTANAWIGDLFSLIAALFWAALALVTRTTRLSKCAPEMNLLYQLGFSAVFLILLAPVFGDTVRQLTPEIIAIFLFQVIFVAAVGFLVWMWALTVYPVTEMASFSLLAPVSGVFFGWLIFDDRLSFAFFTAVLLVGAGLVVINRRPTDPHRE